MRADDSPYDAIAELYDPWSRSVVEDVAFYLDEARRATPPVVELGVGTGRIAVPIAAEGISVIGIDSSAGMLEVCRERARLAGVGDRLDLRLGDLRRPPVDPPVELAICPFRSFLHLESEADRRGALEEVFRLLAPGGRLAFDVFTPGQDDVEETHGRWLEREPGIFERALWDQEQRRLDPLGARGGVRDHHVARLGLARRMASACCWRPASRSRPTTAGSTAAAIAAVRTASGSRGSPASSDEG